MPDRFPGYDVLRKRHTPSWNQKTREVIDQRLSLGVQPNFFTQLEYELVSAIADRIVPQPRGEPRINVAILVDQKLHLDKADGFRQPGMPREREAWRIGLQALEAEARQAHGAGFAALSDDDKDALLSQMQQGQFTNAAWGEMPCKTFFKTRMAHDIVFAYYAHPTAWNQIGWGGPASPRGYVRMDTNERDPWEAAEVHDGDVQAARRKNQRVG